MLEFFTANWAEILLAVMALAKTIVNLTPSISDNRIFSYLDLLLDAVIANHTNTDDNGNS